MELRPYEPHLDQSAIFRLWQRTVGPVWTLPESSFHGVITTNDDSALDDHLVYEQNGDICAFIATKTKLSSSVHNPGEGFACIPLLMVDPQYQRKGIGRLLLQAACSQLKEQRAVSRVRLGAGAGAHFWPGVPANMPLALKFFEACGWDYSELNFDLAMELTKYVTPAGIISRVEKSGIRFSPALETDAQAVLQFETKCFPNWQRHFGHRIEQRACQDILIARNADHTIVGTTLIADKQSKCKSDVLWEQLLGDEVGTVDCLGVAEEARGRGIGLALAGRATEILKARRVKTSYLRWTRLADWYGQLGYQVWQEYKVSSKKLN